MLPQAKARMGVIVSSSNRMVEPQLSRFVPRGLIVHVTRMRMAAKWGKAPIELLGDIVAAARLLADAGVDVIVFQATGVAMEMGEGVESEFMNSVAEETGIPTLSATQAIVGAMNALALKRIVVVSSSDAEVYAHERAYLEARGFEIVHDSALGLEGGASSSAVTPDKWVETVVANARPEADGYLLSGSNTTMLEAVGDVEARLGKPAVSGVQASLWAALRRLGTKVDRATLDPALGRLFAAS